MHEAEGGPGRQRSAPSRPGGTTLPPRPPRVPRPQGLATVSGMNDVRNRPPRLGRLPGVQTTTAVLAAGVLALVALYVVLALTGQLTALS